MCGESARKLLFHVSACGTFILALAMLLAAPASAQLAAIRPASPSLLSNSQPAPDQPIKLIMANRSAIRATECWLGSDGNLDYVSVTGVKMTVPLRQFNMPATMAANRHKGVQLLAPPRLAPLRTPKQQ